MTLAGGDVGAVLIGRNEGERLRRCLASARDRVSKLIYVDSGSTDDSISIARSFGADVVSLDLGMPFTASRARTEGFSRLLFLSPDSRYVMFVDGDCEIEKGWIETSTQFLEENPGYAVACGRRRERFPTATRYNAMADKEWDTPIGEANSCGGDALMRVEAVREVGGFDPAMIAGEEPELCRRLRASGWRIMRLDAPMTIHDADMKRFGQWWRRAIRSGFGYAQAWNCTRRGALGEPLYARELSRALIWAGALPLASLVLGLTVDPLFALVWPLAALAQFIRLWRRDGGSEAAFMVVGKYAEITGALRYAWRGVRGVSGGTIVYK